MRILWHEWKMNLKSLLIWAFCVGLCCCGCILLFDSVAESMEEMAQSFAQMGGFSTAFGMDKVSIATIDGFYATEVGIIFSLGGAMFAAMTGAVLLSKEEEGHTVEFLYTMPVSRAYILGWKYVSFIGLLLGFHIICISLDIIGFLGIEARIPWEMYWMYHIGAFVMQVEIGSICFMISAFCRKKQIGMSLGISVLLYFMDVICRIIPDLEFLQYVTPYYYGSAADIFSGDEVRWGLLILGLMITAVSLGVSGMVYNRRDLAN